MLQRHDHRPRRLPVTRQSLRDRPNGSRRSNSPQPAARAVAAAGELAGFWPCNWHLIQLRLRHRDIDDLMPNLPAEEPVAWNSTRAPLTFSWASDSFT